MHVIFASFSYRLFHEIVFTQTFTRSSCSLKENETWIQTRHVTRRTSFFIAGYKLYSLYNIYIYSRNCGKLRQGLGGSTLLAIRHRFDPRDKKKEEKEKEKGRRIKLLCPFEYFISDLRANE